MLRMSLVLFFLMYVVFRKNDGPTSASFSVFSMLFLIIKKESSECYYETILKTSIIKIKEIDLCSPVISILPPWYQGEAVV